MAAMPEPSRQRQIILCADDFAMTEGISSAIEALALAGRLSATSAMVTSRHWPSHGRRLAALRPTTAIGLHLNLTLGGPLGALPGLAPSSHFISIGQITQRALTGRIDLTAVAGEFTRQITAFQQATGHEPDFIDGHQHVHALPGIRRGLLQALHQHPWQVRPLIRDPVDTLRKIAQRRLAVPKSLTLTALARGFGRQIRAAGFPTNDGFSGVSAFQTHQPYADELRRAFSLPGDRMLVMCHPGFPDAELAALDPITERRRQEFDAIMAVAFLPAALWQPNRTSRSIWQDIDS
jgi:chitin disaccharide deacetylase